MKRWSRHRKVTHFKALPYQQVPGVIDKILYSQGMRETRLAFAFLILTAARSGEVRGRAMGRNRPGRPGLEHSRRTHEGRPAPHNPVEY